MGKLLICLMILAWLAPPVFATDPVTVQVLENEIDANINVASLYQVTLKITFDNAIGLNQNAFQITVAQINPTDATLLSRLGDPSSISIPTQLPILITARPSIDSALSFTGAYEIELYTSNLSFTPTFRLFKAPAGGSFEDVTNFTGMGSYRVRGTGGDFSDFLIVADLRSTSAVATSKFNKLQDTLNANGASIKPEMLQNLQTKLTSARTSFNQGQPAQAVTTLESIITDVKADDGKSIPSVYRANDSLAKNVAGKLREQAATLIFTLRP